jgi:hypothetical protein
MTDGAHFLEDKHRRKTPNKARDPQVAGPNPVSTTRICDWLRNFHFNRWSVWVICTMQLADSKALATTDLPMADEGFWPGPGRCLDSRQLSSVKPGLPRRGALVMLK